MSEILFVVPVFKKKLVNECGGTLLLATVLREKAMDVDIYRYYESDLTAEYDVFLNNSITNILAKKPRIVSFFCRGDIYLTNIMVAKKIKELRPDIHIVFGGPQADVASFDTINEIPWVDFCCSGEGETTVYPLFSGLLKGEDVSHIRGLTYRNEKGEVISNPRPELLEDLDSLPFIDYTLLPQDLLDEIKENPSVMSLDVGRGCPFNCSYCSTSLFWQRKFRLKSPERIVKEIKHLHDEYGITQFSFDHDLFTADKARLLHFCKILQESGLKVEWSCSSRADTIDEETVDAMASAGMSRIFLGIETGSERMQKIIHKNLNIEKTRHIIGYLSKKGIKATASFIYAFPEETKDDLEETFRLIYDLYVNGSLALQFHPCSILPGTEYYAKYKDELVWAETATDHGGNLGIAENADFIKEHKNLFPFYYELHSDIRTRLYGLHQTILLFMEAYIFLNGVDPEKTADKYLVDLYLEYNDANKDFLYTDPTSRECSDRKQELFANYISAIYNAEDAFKLKELYKFSCTLSEIKKSAKDTSDVQIFDVDINAYIKKQQLKDIKKRTSMVHITMVNKKITCGVQHLD